MNREELPQEASREDKMRDALKHYEELATKACWHRSDIPEAIRAYYASLPPAEGAKTCWNCGIDLRHAPDGVTAHHCSCGATNPGERQPQPTAEGAEEILLKHGFFVMTHKEGSEHVRKVFIEPVIAAMTEFATLHAQRIADKMVSERLREKYVLTYEELRKVCCDFFRSWWNTPGSNTDQGFDAWALKTGLKK